MLIKFRRSWSILAVETLSTGEGKKVITLVSLIYLELALGMATSNLIDFGVSDENKRTMS